MIRNFSTYIRCILILLGFVFCKYTATAQSKDVRSHAEHFSQTGELKLKYEYFYDNWAEKAVEHGRYSEWSVRGHLTVDAFYKQGKKDSLFQSWTRKSGQFMELSWWKNGKRHGHSRYFDRHGRVDWEADYKKGALHGIQTVFYKKSGKVKSIRQFKNGRLHGFSTSFNSRGKKKNTTAYDDGRKVKSPKGKVINDAKRDSPKKKPPEPAKK